MNRISRLLPLLSVLAMGRVSADESPRLLSDPVDISGDFHDFSTTYFLADRFTAFDPVKAEGTVLWRRNELAPRIAFDNMEPGLRPFGGSGDFWEEIFNSQSPQYGGWNDSGNYLANLVVQSDGRFYIRLPKWSVLIFRKH